VRFLVKNVQTVISIFWASTFFTTKKTTQNWLFLWQVLNSLYCESLNEFHCLLRIYINFAYLSVNVVQKWWRSKFWNFAYDIKDYPCFWLMSEPDDSEIINFFYWNRACICFKLNDLILHSTFKIGTNLLKTSGLKFLLSKSC